MATRTTDPLLHMHMVVEVGESRQVVDALPFERFSGAIALAHWRQHIASHPHLRMAVHANFRGGHPRVGVVLHRRMAVAAIDAEESRMMFMTERDRLHALDAGAGAVGRPEVDEARPQRQRT